MQNKIIKHIYRKIVNLKVGTLFNYNIYRIKNRYNSYTTINEIKEHVLIIINLKLMKNTLYKKFV